ncbi:MAG: VOC family protein [Sedimentisphaerales bacterium]|nr:VOC family protein [Sedimentisphaerales bacterium]
MTSKLIRNLFPALILVFIGLCALGCSGFMKGQSVKKASFEHVAINVKDPAAMADWYCKNLGMKIMFKGDAPGNARFVSDAGGNMMFELYSNTSAAIPDYASQDMLVLHFAFQVENVKETCDKLIESGAKWDKELTKTDSGDEIATLRDPWGIAIQFVKRAKPMI